MSKIGNSVQACVSWMPCHNGQIPHNAIEVGGGVFIARANIEGCMTPGKAAHGHECGFFAHGGDEHCINSCEVLVDTGLHAFGSEHHWEYACDGNVPKRALVGGYICGSNEPMYVARAQIDGDWVAGKVAGSHNCGFFPYGGKEHILREYEVFCLDKC